MEQPILFINASDVSGLTGKNKRSAQRILARVRKGFEKLPYRPVTVDEFCSFTGADVEVVRHYLRSKE